MERRKFIGSTLAGGIMLGGQPGDPQTTSAIDPPEFIEQFLISENAELGKKYGLQFAEQYHYIGREEPVVNDYVAQHAVPL